jgi:nicotinamide-nucleotide amidase
MNAVILAIGDELVSGQTVDSNSAYLARKLGERGIACGAHATLPDRRGPLSAGFDRAARDGDIVLATGGLGPTADDLTRQALADALGCGLTMDEASLAHIAELFDRRGRTMTDANRIQAMVPDLARPIRNEVGTAPGIYAELHGAKLFALPGVPSEMRWMFDHGVACHLPAGGGVILHHLVLTYGLGESDVGSRIADLMKRDGPLKVGTTAAAGLIGIRITAEGESESAAGDMIETVVADVRNRLGDVVVGRADETLAAVVLRLLRQRGQMLATAESCTGGGIGAMLTSVAGSSDAYAGGVVTYTNELKQSLLGVPDALLAAHGAVSEPVARAMAEGCRERLGVDWAVAVTGIAGPGGGSADKPVGLVHSAVAGPDGTTADRHVFGGDRQGVRTRAAYTVLNALRLRLVREA